uniref:MADF domain-containing protein n=1 Tax=Oreochromis niloticus TaxID=8128 RepID=A0A669F7W9_ORENI
TAASASLILAVFNYPELYNVTLPNYRCTESRTNAWRSISMELGLPSECECKRRWKNMRDRYLKEVRMELKSKKQGENVQSKWKYRQLMNFIAPFTGSRSGLQDISANNDVDHDNPEDSSNVDGENVLSEAIKTPQSAVKVPTSLPDLKPQVTFVTQLPQTTQDTQVAQLAVLAKIPSPPQVSPVTGITGQKRKPPRDEDELFLLSFVPALKRLAPQKRCETKIKIQQIMYEAEFNVTHPESQEKKVETETQH